MTPRDEARCGWRLAALVAAALLAAPAAAQDGGMEVFEEVDPYTGGEHALMAKLGYVSYGPFPWRDSDRTVDVQQNMGGIPMLWVETEHFRIGSSLVTYDIPNDREERARLKAEIARLKKKLGRLKAPKKELDPWLRLHLYAQRAEDLYRAFLDDFGLEPADYEEMGPHLGQERKFLLLLCERKSEFVRYLQTYLDVENEYSFRFGWPDGGAFYGANVEAIRESWGAQDSAPFDSMLHCKVITGVTANFVDAYRMNLFGAPVWLEYALGHAYTRRVDPRWVTSCGREEGRAVREDDWKWESRVRNLVQNDFFAKAEEMFAWQEYEDMEARDHMVAWSKLDYLLREAEGDAGCFLGAVCLPVPAGEGEELAAALVERQTRALADCFGLEPAELDQAWARWVKRTYKKR